MKSEVEVVSLYVTVSNAEEAARIGRQLVEERLVACVNVLGTIRSIYRWEGRVHDDSEVAFFAKTRRDLVPVAIKRVRQLHSYSNPCIVALTIEAGSPEYLSWIHSETHL